MRKHTALYAEIIAAYTSDSQLWEALDAYIEMRSVNKMALTERAIRMLLKRLDAVAITITEKISVVENATMGAWKSFYGLSPTRCKPATTHRNSSYDINELEELIRRNIL